MKPLSIAVTPEEDCGDDVCASLALVLLLLLVLLVELSIISPVLLTASCAVVWLNMPTTLCGKFEGLVHLTLEPASTTIAFGINIFTSVRTISGFMVSEMTLFAC